MTIWCYEEPENNLEISNARALVDDLFGYANNGVQIFITSHSPAFYEFWASRKENIKTFYVKKEDTVSTITEDLSKVNDELWVFASVARLIGEIEEEKRKNDDLTRQLDVLLQTSIRFVVIPEEKSGAIHFKTAWHKYKARFDPSWDLEGLLFEPDRITGGDSSIKDITKKSAIIHGETFHMALFDSDTNPTEAGQLKVIGSNLAHYYLPVPEHRSSEYQSKGVCIELYFSDEELKVWEDPHSTPRIFLRSEFEDVDGANGASFWSLNKNYFANGLWSALVVGDDKAIMREWVRVKQLKKVQFAEKVNSEEWVIDDSTWERFFPIFDAIGEQLRAWHESSTQRAGVTDNSSSATS